MLENGDLDRLAGHAVHLNLDTRSVLRRFAAIAGPGRRVGLRIDPRVLMV
jgi:diaminopimelate decarboxylase